MYSENVLKLKKTFLNDHRACWPEWYPIKYNDLQLRSSNPCINNYQKQNSYLNGIMLNILKKFHFVS